MRDNGHADPWKDRVDSGNWGAIAADVSSFGGALLPELLSPAAPVRHGVSVVRSGQRHTLGLVFHDAP